MGAGDLYLAKTLTGSKVVPHAWIGIISIKNAIPITINEIDRIDPHD
ncbi:hypothetical protein JCM19238_3162 [Vibrio ponticus]|nr:hypothetical protein JCM19238_3162 [Vibrio ponticus]